MQIHPKSVKKFLYSPWKYIVIQCFPVSIQTRTQPWKHPNVADVALGDQSTEGKIATCLHLGTSNFQGEYEYFLTLPQWIRTSTQYEIYEKAKNSSLISNYLFIKSTKRPWYSCTCPTKFDKTYHQAIK